MKHDDATSTSLASTEDRGVFSEIELGAYRAMQARYSEDRGFFSAAHRDRLRFMRWLVEKRAIEP
jgi:hypothetical protein